MHHRPVVKFRPGLESLEEKRLMSVRAFATPAAALRPGARAQALRQAAAGQDQGASTDTGSESQTQTTAQSAPPLVMSRITNPTPINHILIPPFEQVRVQSNDPVPGQTYNVYFVSVRNSTRLTFDANSGFFVRLSGQTAEHAYPILTGDQQWKPNQVMVFYVLTKQYYPARPLVSGGFEFNLGGSRGVAIGGPSAIFLRIKYDPAKFPRMLDWMVVRGPGAYGHRTGLADTAIWEFRRA
jgi:hypothetical protein